MTCNLGLQNMQEKGRIRWATETDVPAVMELIRELAEYERALDQVNIGEDVLLRDGFGPDPAYGLLVLEPADRDEVVGIALFYQKYSTWNGRCLYLEDRSGRDGDRAGQGIRPPALCCRRR